MEEIKNAVILLDILSDKDYKEFEKFSFLIGKTDEEIWKYYPKIGEPRNDIYTTKTPIIEAYMLFNKLKRDGINPIFWKNVSLFIYNNDIYKISEKKLDKIPDGTFIFSFRDSLSHPFFNILNIVLNRNGGKLCKPNKDTMINKGCLNKFQVIEDIYGIDQCKTYFKNILIPYNLKKSNLKVLLNFILLNIGKEFIIKQDCIQEGKGVYPFDISILDKPLNNKKLNNFLNLLTTNKKVFLTPFFNIKNEYRVYFNKSSNDDIKINIYTIKKRINLTSNKDLLSKDNFKIYENIETKWRYLPKDTKEYNTILGDTFDIIHELSFNTGTLEILIDEEDNNIILEVNQMAGPLPFREDEKDMIEFYQDMIENMIEN